MRGLLRNRPPAAAGGRRLGRIAAAVRALVVTAPEHRREPRDRHGHDDVLTRIAALRPDGPVHRLPGGGEFLVIGYDAVRTALAEPETYSSACLRSVDPVLLAADPPAHGAVRQRLARHFGAAALADTIALLDAEARRLVQPRFDLVADYALPLTRRVTGRFLGLAPEQVEAMIGTMRRNLADGTGDLASVHAAARYAQMHATLVDERLGGFGDAEACSLVALLAMAASETAERLIIQCVLALLEDATLAAAVAAGGAARQALIEEVLRLYPPEPAVVRVATRETQLGGAILPAGARVLLSLAGANRDPARFPDPDAVRLDRSGPPHIAFGGGAHHCLGAGLGRRVAGAALAALLAPPHRLHAAEPLSDLRFGLVQGMRIPLRLKVAA